MKSGAARSSPLPPALWLKDMQGGADHFFALPPAFAPVLPLHDYLAADFLSLLCDLARQKAPLERQVAL